MRFGTPLSNGAAATVAAMMVVYETTTFREQLFETEMGRISVFTHLC
jgi:hypothetical protein